MVEQLNTNTNTQDCNIVIVGHVNTGKSTLAGRILVDLGMVDEREMNKLKQDAIKNGRESWYLSYVID